MRLRLKELRRERHFTLKQVGKHLNKSYATISRAERGLIPIASTDLLKLAALYGVHIRDLWQDQQDQEEEAS